MLITERAQTLHEFFRRDVETTLALHRFDDDGGDVARLGVVLENPLDAGDGVVSADAVQFAGVLGAEHAAGHQAHAGRVGIDLAGQ
ncbi:hypothetical protein FQZ97_1079030 [compost metagenome]